MDIMNLWRRKTVQLKVRIIRTQSAQEVFIPLETEVWMQPALHQHSRTAERDGLVNLRANLIHRAHISVRGTGPSIKGAEGADHVADVGVVDVSIDDVGDDVVRVTALANLIRSRADFGHVVG